MKLSELEGAGFELPADLEAASPPEARGLRRDGVRLMVAHKSDPGQLEHRYFADLPSLFEPGDVLAVNTSATLPARLEGTIRGGATAAAVHLATPRPDAPPVVELRHLDRVTGVTSPWLDASPGTVVDLPGGATVRLVMTVREGSRLWLADLRGVHPLLAYLARHGKPIRYSYVPQEWPISYYQTVFADIPGSAEMPSAARPFSTEVTTRLVSRGVQIAPLVLHCAVSSLEAHEPPSPEWFRVPASTATLINTARLDGHRIIAVGTTAVRALESASDGAGLVHEAGGWTELVITSERPARVVSGLITGWHEPGASHLALLEAVAGREVVEASYRAALAEGYLWHEFGDSHLILP
ncbi:MAG: S-adenosylmethionine:tRNA ribosyltransferase-isomerase [Acidimicrobiales bacterium]|nr:S-adenosylmethionine:tRNA ribosyltransferase-isomerase [Acidimicrobiales bacterium]